ALGVIGNLHSRATPGGSSEQSSADTGRLISNYELQKKLGEGGMGAVYLARHLRLKKSVAIKLLKGERSQDDSAVARFQVEIEAVGKLEHPHIVRALDAGEDRGTHFLVMEYLAGIDVARLVRGLGPLGLPEACELVRQAALGLHHAHENDVIHRDVKPSNLMLLAGGKVKVLDLGLAHFRPDWGQSHGLTRADQVLGTLLYVAPEQLAPGGKVDARTDVYSLGVTLAEILLGRVPCRSGHSVLLGDEERAARPDVPPDIWQLIARMTNLDPHARPASMLTVAETLRPWCAAANLGRLLERVAGQTAFADPTIPAAGLAGPPLHATTPGGASYDPELGEVVPPPIAGVIEMPGYSTAAIAISELDFHEDDEREPNLRLFGQRADSLTRRLIWLTAGSALSLLLVLAIWGLRQPSKSPAPVPPGPTPPLTSSSTTGGIPESALATGTIEIKSDDPIYAGLVQAILQDSALLAVPTDGGSPVTLHEGAITLAPGQYKLVRAPDPWPVEQHDWGIEQTIVVEAGETKSVEPMLRFSTLWKFPRIPEPGQWVNYSGSLTSRLPPDNGDRAPGGDDSSVAATGITPQYFDLEISTLVDEMVEGKPHRWLKLELTDKAADYRETAHLLVDTHEYRQHHRLVIERGWIEATSTAIAAALAREFPESPPLSLVAEFDMAADRLIEPARRIRLTLPRDRIGIHTALVLLFDADCQAAPAPMRTIRASLPEPTRYTLATINPGSGLRTGMVIEAEQRSGASAPVQQPKNKTLLQVKRSETVPFSFVSLHLDCPQLAAELKIAAHTEFKQPMAVGVVPLDRLTATNQRILELPLEADPLDVATLPADGMGVRYLGAIKFPRIPKFSAPFFGEIKSDVPILGELNYNARVRMLGTEVIDGRNHRWLEVEVTTKQAGNS
ncbi:MAG: serine/threonine protein kinase, partial [Pirellulaceae bacterium]|nr:serine/threonine protein kinase [Pirellulaceae bacterium]